MQRDNHYLFDILESAKLTVTYLGNKTREEFVADSQCQDAIIRRFEIIGEAANKVSKATRDQMPELPWNEMIGMRNLLIHEYDIVDAIVLWDTVKEDTPRLIAQLEVLFP